LALIGAGFLGFYGYFACIAEVVDSKHAGVVAISGVMADYLGYQWS